MTDAQDRPLTLPEPGRTLLRTTREILDRYLPEVMPPGEVWRLGGGTALAGDWEHRNSTDIDIKVHRDTELHRLQNTGFRAALIAAGAGEPAIERMAVAHFRKGRLEIFAADTIPETGATARVIDGQKTAVQSPAQILTGKLARSLNPPARDVYDFAVAGRCDPRSLSEAASITDPGWLNATLRAWHEDRRNLTEETRETVTGTPSWAREYWKHPVEHAITAVLENTYQRLCIEADNGAIRIEAHTARTKHRFRYTNVEDLEEGLRRTGLGNILVRSGPAGEHARESIISAMRAGKSGTLADLTLNRPDTPIGHAPPRPPEEAQVHRPAANETARQRRKEIPNGQR